MAERETDTSTAWKTLILWKTEAEKTETAEVLPRQMHNFASPKPSCSILKHYSVKLGFNYASEVNISEIKCGKGRPLHLFKSLGFG